MPTLTSQCGIPCYSKLHQAKVLIEGPGGTPFEQGIFLLDVVFPIGYPFKPPKIRFETPVFHCNVSSSGGICLDILRDQWSPALSLLKCLNAIRDMMARPNTDDALRPAIAEVYFAYRRSGGADRRYLEQAERATLQDASRTVREWNSLWGI